LRLPERVAVDALADEIPLVGSAGLVIPVSLRTCSRPTAAEMHEERGAVHPPRGSVRLVAFEHAVSPPEQIGLLVEAQLPVAAV